MERSPGEDAAATAQSAAKSSGVGGMVSLAKTINERGRQQPSYWLLDSGSQMGVWEMESKG